MGALVRKGEPLQRSLSEADLGTILKTSRLLGSLFSLCTSRENLTGATPGVGLIVRVSSLKESMRRAEVY
jgi:hypothetical protein